MNTDAIFYASILLSFLCFGLTAKWYIMPNLRSMPTERALMPLLLVHSTRYLGLTFLLPGVVSSALPPAFAKPAAYGDLLAALLALLALAALRLHLPGALVLVWVFNIFGTADFLVAFFQGFRNHIQPGHLGAVYFIPTVAVPALFIVHVMIFQLLLHREPAT